MAQLAPPLTASFEPFVNATEASQFVRLHPATVQRLAREGTLPGHPVGSGQRRRWRFRLSELQDWLSSRNSADA